MDESFFKVLCEKKDFKSSNLNQLFESYGCNRLEAKVPIVDKDIVETIEEADTDKEKTLLSLQANSSRMAVEGRFTRMKNKNLKLVEIDGTTIIQTTTVREKSPVNIENLDDELDEYVKERDRLAKQLKACEQMNWQGKEDEFEL